ncbi:MAG: hypothetical protein V8Q30_00780 [Acutalibacteraceae bacterium]
MRGSIQKLTLAGQEISLYLPPKALRNTPCRLLLAADGELLFEILTQLANTLEARMAEENRGLILVGLHSENRDADYTPWPAPGFDEDYPDFPGKAGEYLRGSTGSCCRHSGRSGPSPTSPAMWESSGSPWADCWPPMRPMCPPASAMP